MIQEAGGMGRQGSVSETTEVDSAGLGVFRRRKVKAAKAHFRASGLCSQVDGVQSLEHCRPHSRHSESMCYVNEFTEGRNTAGLVGRGLMG